MYISYEESRHQGNSLIFLNHLINLCNYKIYLAELDLRANFQNRPLKVIDNVNKEWAKIIYKIIIYERSDS